MCMSRGDCKTALLSSDVPRRKEGQFQSAERANVRAQDAVGTMVGSAIGGVIGNETSRPSPMNGMSVLWLLNLLFSVCGVVVC